MLRILLVDAGGKRSKHYAHLRAHYDADWRGPLDRRHLHTAGDIDIALISDEFKPETWLAMRELQRVGVPVLHVVDGIVEWRNCWENPRSLSADRGLPLFQPVLADKIACLGRSQARVIESWGNAGRCEVVGSPRLDPLFGQQARKRRTGEPFRILVATARKPGFTEWQIECVRHALMDLQKWDGRTVAGQRVELCWRVTHGLDQTLGVAPRAGLTDGELVRALTGVDALITTPSTVMLEGMLVGLPVALIDYTNSPNYVPAAWTVSAPEHLERVLSELVAPPAAKILYQNWVLHDALECETPATPRMIELIQAMADIARSCRARGSPVVLPSRLVASNHREDYVPEERFDLHALYPGHPVFGELDRAALQIEVSQLRIALERAERAIDRHQRERSVLRKVWRRFEQNPLVMAALRLRRRALAVWARPSEAPTSPSGKGRS